MKTMQCKFVDQFGLVCEVHGTIGNPLLFSRRRLAKYWTSARRRYIDGASCSILDSFLMVHFSEGSGQGGCLAFVDIAKNKVVHVSSGAFLTNVTILDSKYVFCVMNVSFWGHGSSWHVEWRDLHSKTSVLNSDNVVCRIDIPCKFQFGTRDSVSFPSLMQTDGYNVVLSGGGDRYEACFSCNTH